MIRITKHKSKFRKEKRRREKKWSVKIALKPSCNPGMKSLQIFTSTHSVSPPNLNSNPRQNDIENGMMGCVPSAVKMSLFIGKFNQPQPHDERK